MDSDLEGARPVHRHRRRRRSRSESTDSRVHQRQRRYRQYNSRSNSPSHRRNRDHHSRRHHRRHRYDNERSFSSSTATLSRAPPRAGVVSEDDNDRCVQSTQRSSLDRNDTIGHFNGGPGTLIDDRYKIVQDVGVGTFGRVVECRDLRHRGRQNVAIKVVRNVKKYYDSALIEARVIDNVNSRGGRGVTHCVVMHSSFPYRGHYCMVFEKLGPSLYHLLKKNDFKAFPMICVQDFTVQLLETLEFLHSFRLIHTDLKIENVLLMNDRELIHQGCIVPESTRIKVIDFGGACFDDECKSAVINTRQYRAPEVILGTGWSMPSDMWSLGCILAELYQGQLLFATHDNVEHLALMERIVGRFPRRFLERADSYSDVARTAFDLKHGHHRGERILSPESHAFVRDCVPLNNLQRQKDDAWFIDLLRMMLVIDPAERSTAHECLRFLSSVKRYKCNAL